MGAPKVVIQTSRSGVLRHMKIYGLNPARPQLADGANRGLLLPVTGHLGAGLPWKPPITSLLP